MRSTDLPSLVAQPAASMLAELLHRARLIVFDFDGTLVDSNPIKQQAFAECFGMFPEQLNEIMTFCIGRHDLPRAEKFRAVYDKILRRPYTPEIAAVLHRRFDALTTQQIISAPSIEGAQEFLRLAGRRGPTALLSTTPHAVLDHIIEQRGWRSYFTMIQGAPIEKAAWLSALQEQQGVSGDAMIFFGDTAADADAAAAAHCPFIWIGRNASERFPYAIPTFAPLALQPT